MRIRAQTFGRRLGADVAASSSDFAARFEAADPFLGGPIPGDAEREARLALWNKQEWHDWFRWRFAKSGFDRPVWLIVLAGGMAGLIAFGLSTSRWEITAGGVVAWFTLVNLGFFSYLGLRPPVPPRPVPGPFLPGRPVRAILGLYPAGYDRRPLARIWLRIPRAPDMANDEDDSAPEWLLELAVAEGLPPEFAELTEKQKTFRIQRADAPAMTAVCEVVKLSRTQIDAGELPLRIVAWNWDEQSTKIFGRPGRK